MKKKDIQTIMIQGMNFISTIVNALIPEDEKEGEENDKKRDTEHDRAKTEQH
jgi:hypothetical protein